MSNRQISLQTYTRPQASEFLLGIEDSIPEPTKNLEFKVGLGKLLLGSYEKPTCKMTSLSFADRDNADETIQEVLKNLTHKKFSLDISNEQGMLFISGDIPLARDYSRISCIYVTSKDFNAEVDKASIKEVTSVKNGSVQLDNSVIEYNGFHQSDLDMEGVSFTNVRKGPLEFKIKNAKKGAQLVKMTYPDMYTLSRANDLTEFKEKGVECTLQTKGNDPTKILVDVDMVSAYSLDLSFPNFPVLSEDGDMEIKCPSIDIVSYYPFDPIVNFVVNHDGYPRYYAFNISSDSEETSHASVNVIIIGLMVVSLSLVAMLF